MTPVSIRIIGPQEVIPIRQIILRPGRPVSECVFAHDDDADTRHFGAFVDGTMLGVASVYRDKTDVGAWQLRGMAVLEDSQRRGVGSALLRACCEHVVAQGGSKLWCNARITAAAFYAKHGFETAGAEFISPDVGPHYVMQLVFPV
jgi:N-acetylglutamate synthase-like GNAT family acetyltransferase